MKRLNAAGVPRLAAAPTMDAGELADAVRRGAQLVDVRPPADFAVGHLPNALNIPLGRSFLGWAGSVLPADRDLVLVAPAADRATAERTARDLRVIGVDRVLGVLAPEQLATASSVVLPTVEAATLGARAPHDATVLDVRNRSEWLEGHVPGARHIPLAELTARLEELRGSGPLLVHCQGGSRSAVASSVLLAAGFPDVSNVAGGYAAWERAGYTPERDD
jgi:hydroxyacylglutathione hydrolase